jgi:hypothetical protein
MATTPSGLNIADAEALSKQYQQTLQNLQGKIPEGQYFLKDIGEGGKSLIQYQGGKLVGLGFDPQTLKQDTSSVDALRKRSIDEGWTYASGNSFENMLEGMYNTGQLIRPGEINYKGKTIGEWTNDLTDEAINNLGIDRSQIIDLTDSANALYREAIPNEVEYKKFDFGGDYSKLFKTAAQKADISDVQQQYSAYNQAANTALAGINPANVSSHLASQGNVQTAGSTTGQQGSTGVNTNPFFGIPASVSGKLTTPEQAQQYKDLKAQGLSDTEILKQLNVSTSQTGWVDQTTGQQTPAGVGMPSGQMGKKILNEADLQAKRDELAKAGVPQSEWNKYISSPDATGALFWNQPATLYSSTGEKKVVATGSTEASQLLSQGWTLNPQQKQASITSADLIEQPPIDMGDFDVNMFSDYSKSNTAAASAATTATNTDNYIAQLQQMLTMPDTSESKLLDQLNQMLLTDTQSLTGRGAAQAQAEEAAGIQATKDALATKNGELKTKLAELEALKASYEIANLEEEGRPQTLSRLQGAQGRNYKMYMAQANRITSEAGYLQAEILGLQGQLEASQEAANRAVDLEYADREAAYNAKLQMASILEKQVDKQEATYLSAVQMYLQEKQDAVAEEKANKKAILDVKLQAISAGITDPSVLAKIGGAKTYDEALQVLGTNMPDTSGGLGDMATNDYKNWLLAGGENSGYTFAEWQGKASPGEQSAYLQQVSERTLRSINELLPQINSNTTGWGAFLTGKLPESEARSFAAQLDTLKSNITFGALVAMREASKTGGALGQVSDREGKLLESSLGALDQLQSADQLKSQLKKIKDSITRFNDAVAVEGGIQSGVQTSSQYSNAIDTALNSGWGAKDIVSYLGSTDDNLRLPIEEAIKSGYDDNEILNYIRGFNSDRKVSLNYTPATLKDVQNIKDFSKVNTAFGSGVATGIQGGSSKWKYGLDFVLNGGKGAPVKFPIGGKVVSAKYDGGFGNSVKIQTPDGKVVRISHLDKMNVKPGQTINAGTFIGTQGNTGSVIKVGKGGTGTHLDITVYKPDGKPYTSQEVAAMFNTKLA